VASGKELTTLMGHDSGVNSVAFSPDGTLIAAGSIDNTIKLWVAVTGKELTTLKGHDGGVDSVAFSPDGTRIASCSDDQTIKLWDAASGKEIITFKGPEVSNVAFSPDGTRLASGSKHHTIKLWNAGSDKELTTLKGHTDEVWSVTYSPDGTRIYSKAGSEEIVWDSKTGRPIENADWMDLEDKNNVTPDGRWLVTSEGKNVLVVDLEYKNTPREKAYRQAKARPKPFWHLEQAKKAEQEKDWFAATFHRAWVMKSDPEQAKSFDLLHKAREELEREFAQKNKDGDKNLSDYLSPVVKTMLELPRGK